MCGRDAQDIDAHFFCLLGNLPLIDSSSIERKTPSSRYLSRSFHQLSFIFLRALPKRFAASSSDVETARAAGGGPEGVESGDERCRSSDRCLCVPALEKIHT